MALKIETNRYDVGDQTQGQNFTLNTSVGFGTPVAMIAVWNGFTRAALNPNHSFGQLSIGFCDGTEDVAFMSGQDTDKVSAQQKDHAQHGRGRLGLINGQGTTAATNEISFVSFGTDQVTLNMDDNETNPSYLTITFFTGTDISNVVANYYDDLGAGTTPFNVNLGSGVQADLVFCGAVGNPGALAVDGDTDHAADLNLTFGVWDRVSDKQRCVAMESDNAVYPSQISSVLYNDCAMAKLNSDALEYKITLSSHADGFTVTPSASAGNDLFFYLAFKFAKPPTIDIIDVTLPASGNYVETGASTTPEAALITMTDCTAVNTLITSGDQGISIHTLDTSNAFSQGFKLVDAVTTTDGCGYSSNDFTIYNGAGSALDDQGAFSGFNSDGWTIALGSGTNDGVQRKGWAISLAAGAGPAITDVNGTESWTDGATGLVITGTDFV